jgi:hypothetical protein
MIELKFRVRENKKKGALAKHRVMQSGPSIVIRMLSTKISPSFWLTSQAVTNQALPRNPSTLRVVL